MGAIIKVLAENVLTFVQKTATFSVMFDMKNWQKFF